MALSVLKGGVELNVTVLRRLIRFRRLLRALINKETPLKRRREYLTQRGGNLLSYLLPPALSTLAALFAE